MPETTAEFIALQSVLSGRYSLERELGRGGMGIVFLARDVALNRPVAIKLLPPHFAREPEMRARFMREARTAAGLFHPNIVPIHLVEEDGDLVFFVMAYVQGESLGVRVRRAGPMPAAAVRRMIQEVAWALSYAHEKGVVHRDIKPDNILLERPGGRALVADFGIARVTEASGGTARGEVLGTVEYMSPEQATGERVDGRSDLYSLGATAFFALTGRLPFEAANPVALIHKHVNLSAPRVASLAKSVPAKLAEAVDRCLAKDPAQRFATGEALAEAVAEAGTATVPVPPEVRRLLRRIRTVSAIAGVLSGSSMIVGFLAPTIGRVLSTSVTKLSLNSPDAVLLVLLALLPFTAPLRRLFGDARRVIRAGYGMSFVREALSGEARAMIEEGLVEAGTRDAAEPESPSESRPKSLFMPSGHPERSAHPARWPHRVVEPDSRSRDTPVNPVIKKGLQREATIRYAQYFLLAAPLLWWGGRDVYLLAPFALLLGLFGVAAGPAVGKDSPLVALDWGERLLIGRFGRLLFRLARLSMGLKSAERTSEVVVAGERTEVALVSAIGDLIERLPRDVRARFGNVSDVIRRLEGDAAALRERETSVSDALARVEMHAPSASRDDQRRLQEELEAARTAVRNRLATTVAAIESIRLDLLRLHAGVGSAEDLTADLERARDVAGSIDRELAARAEVEELLSPGQES